MASSQSRPPLTRALQQLAATPAASLVSAQISEFDADAAMPADSDLAACDASSAAFTLDLPGWSSVYEGKPYWILEWEGTNGVTIDPGAGTIDGAASYALPAGQAVCLVPYAVDDATQTVSWASLASTPGAGGAIAQSQVSSTVVLVASDAAAAILSTTGGIQLAESAVGAKAIATTSSYAGQKVHLILLAASGGSYTLALNVGTLTFNAAGESAVVQRNAANTAWVCVGLSGATIV